MEHSYPMELQIRDCDTIQVLSSKASTLLFEAHLNGFLNSLIYFYIKKKIYYLLVDSISFPTAVTYPKIQNITIIKNYTSILTALVKVDTYPLSSDPL